MTTSPPNRLAQLRGDVSPLRLALDLGVDPSTIARWERRPDALRVSPKAPAVAAYFNVSLGYLLGFEAEPAVAAA